MSKTYALRATVAVLALSHALPASAGVLTFTGDLSARAVVGPDPACAPSFRGVIAPADTLGSSSLGAFTYGHTVCTAGQAGGPVTGNFLIAFASDNLFGTLAGIATPTATPPVATLDFLYTVLGGTGRFEGASGTFTGIGQADPRVRPSQINLRFNGAINAVPEPGTWALLILGFGGVGATMRLRTRRPAMA